jgi:ribonuclease R
MDKRIISLLRNEEQGLSLQKIIRGLNLSVKQKTPLRRTLRSLEKKGVIQRVKRRYFIPSKGNLIRGKFTASFNGYGFVSPEGKREEDIFIPARSTKEALSGDVVEILYIDKGKKGKPEGSVLKIVKEGKDKLVGLYGERLGQPYFKSIDMLSAEEKPITSKQGFSPLPGMIVVVDRKTMKLTEIYGMPDDPGVDTKVVIQKHNLFPEFSKEALEESKSISVEINPEEISRRVDYRDWKTVTIDGESAQDFDDAVSLKKLNNGHFLLGIHIADVSHYVKPGTAIDQAAFLRGTSVYFPDLTLPMLPEILSNNICSLRPKEERLTLTVVLEIDARGEIKNSEFHPSVIQTAERMTYDSVFKIFREDKKERARYKHLVPDLLLMRELARILRDNRKSRGSLDFDLTEPELVYREGELSSVEPVESNEAHKVIEEFMVVANEAVAIYLSRKKMSFIYRIHPRPAPKNLEKLKEIIAFFGLSLPHPSRVESKHLQEALKLGEGKREEKFIGLQVLKSLKIAIYSEGNLGHYGLAKKEYTHFTSPIRRYPDLVVHRILKKALKGEETHIPELSSIALHSSHRERASESAERELVVWRILRFLRKKIGEELGGIIVDISRSRLVVELDNYFVGGIVFFNELGNDFYYKASGTTLVGRRTGKKFKLGEKIRVVLVSIDPLLRRMALSLGKNRRKN